MVGRLTAVTRATSAFVAGSGAPARPATADGAPAAVRAARGKKRGYKSSRKAKNEDEGQLIDGMEIARRLYDENLTTGQLSLQLLKEGKKSLPDYYRSDLQHELDKVWNFQKQFHPDILTDEFYTSIQDKGQKAIRESFSSKYWLWSASSVPAKTTDPAFMRMMLKDILQKND